MKINLKDFYHFIESDQIVEISDAVYDVFEEYERQEKNYREKIRRNKAYYSLDRSDGIENSIVILVATPPELLAQKEVEEMLYKAIQQLPYKQARRLYMYYYLNMSMRQIAKSEKVHRSRISASIMLGLKNLRLMLENRD